LNWVHDTPWFSKSSNVFARNIIGNWTLSGTYILESPQMATVQSAIDSNLNGDSAGDRAIVNINGRPGTGSGVNGLSRTGSILPAGDAGIVAYVAKDSTAQYVVAGLGALTNAGRQTIPSGRINNWDLQIKKQFTWRDGGVKLQLAGQAINVFNHPQYIPGYLNNVQFHDSNDTRNQLIPGNSVFNRPDQVYSSNSRTMTLTGRIQF